MIKYKKNNLKMSKYKYYIEVAVRDAREAQEIYKDGTWSKQGIAMTSTNYYESNNEDSIVGFLDELENNSIEIYETNADAVGEDLGAATGANVNGMGGVSLPNGNSLGSGDIPTGTVKVRKFSDILADMEEDEDEEDVEMELTKEQASAIIDIFMNPESVNESQIELLNEGIFGSILGGIGGLAFGKSIGKLLANTLGIKDNSPLYNVLTSRLVGTAIGAALGKKLKF